MSYIEKDRDGEFFNPSLETVAINPSTESSTYISPSDENKKRWSWLIDGWSKMDFKQKLGLFLPYLHYVNSRNYPKKDFDKYFAQEMIDTSYLTCRNFKGFKFDPDGQGVPNLIMEFAPIDIRSIPDSTIQEEVKSFGNTIGMYNRYAGCYINPTPYCTKDC